MGFPMTSSHHWRLLGGNQGRDLADLPAAATLGPSTRSAGLLVSRGPTIWTMAQWKVRPILMCVF